MRMRHWSRYILALVPGLFASVTFASDYDLPEAPAEVVLEGEPVPSPNTTLPEATLPPQSVEFDTSLHTWNAGGDAAVVSPQCDCYCPSWTVRTGIIFLRRDGQENQTLTDGATPITIDGFRSYEAGPLLSLIRHNVLHSCWDLEVTYFGVSSFEDTASSLGVTQIATTPPIFFGGGGAVVSDYRSSIHSTEINFLRNRNSRFSLLGGFRWIELGDELATDIGGVASTSVNVNNHLYGVQIGAQAQMFCRGAFSVEGFGKAGIYSNAADQSTTTVAVGGAVPALSASGTNVAFVGEIGLTGVYTINERCSLRSGYQVLWIDGAALAPDQLATSDIVTGLTSLDTSGHPIYHGFTLAADFRW